MRTRQQSADRLAARNRAQAAVNAEASRVADELKRREMVSRDGYTREWVLWVGMGIDRVAIGREVVAPVRRAKRLYDLVLDLLGAREDRERLKAENDAMRAAILPVVENLERWNVGGEPATADQSRAMYLALCESIGRNPEV